MTGILILLVHTRKSSSSFPLPPEKLLAAPAGVMSTDIAVPSSSTLTYHPPPPPPPHPIFNAIYQQTLNLDYLQSLISSDPSCLAAVNAGNSYTPLHAAARRGDPALTRLLVEAGSSLEAQGRYGETPFLIACQV